MEEQKKVVASATIDLDTKEADKKIKELTAAANECVEAFERLGDAITNVGSMIQISDAKEMNRGELIEVMMKGNS
ncbi:hypothetical protein CON65_02435 [Bacillus pseudomycoides]|uniref:Uncharacterized protein n=2 Tax=Bacillaceae TaxID=186817 RepID=A0AA91ZVE1_9BACI|nr:hypothetical protein CON65_02435 [Bacillus pseudomycoides]PEU15839.1 hypothetical protein CN524_06140 [Bacillus sp. AFS019443]PEU19725.1 hypothetical protein CN525_06140 [Bacillus sp. AFS014408]PFW64861.1 hypothetical protein COL20_02420 [Bacillus sp. AFS075034]